MLQDALPEGYNTVCNFAASQFLITVANLLIFFNINFKKFEDFVTQAYFRSQKS